MSIQAIERTYGRVFTALFAVVGAVTLLSIFGIVGDWAPVATTMTIAAGAIAFFTWVSGPQAKTAALIVLLVSALSYTPT